MLMLIKFSANMSVILSAVTPLVLGKRSINSAAARNQRKVNAPRVQGAEISTCENNCYIKNCYFN